MNGFHLSQPVPWSYHGFIRDLPMSPQFSTSARAGRYSDPGRPDLPNIRASHSLRELQPVGARAKLATPSEMTTYQLECVLGCNRC